MKPWQIITLVAGCLTGLTTIGAYAGGAVDHFRLGPQVASNSEAVEKIGDYIEGQQWFRDFQVCMAGRAQTPQATEICHDVADQKARERNRDEDD